MKGRGADRQPRGKGRADGDRFVQMVGDEGVRFRFWRRRRRRIRTLGMAGFVEDIFLKDHLLLGGGEGVIIIL